MALALAACGAVALGAINRRPSVAPADLALDSAHTPCMPITRFKIIGPELSVREAEAASIAQMRKAPDAPQVPFGYGNGEWLKIRDSLLPGDTLHAFETEVTGGILVLRQGCAVGHVTTWIR